MKRMHLLRLILLCFTTFILSGCEVLDVNLKSDTQSDIESERDYWKEQYESVFDQIIATSEHARESNIYIETTLTYRRYIFETKRGGQGSGFIYKKDANYYYALTNFHVIDPQDATEVDYKVRFSSGKEVVGTVIAMGDENTDLAVIRFPISSETIPLTPMDREAGVKTNEFALVVGNPSGLQNVVTPTQILGYGDYLKGIDLDVYVFSYAMDAHGNSGGAVVDLEGQLLGILTWQGSEEPDKKFAITKATILSFLQEHGLEPE
jgi:S1-C subfamily serine protease